MFSKISNGIDTLEDYLTSGNADSFFENFDQEVNVKTSPTIKTEERKLDSEFGRINYDGRAQQNKICKSLERVFQMCNNNPTIKKTFVNLDLKECDQSVKTKLSTQTQEDMGSVIPLGKYTESNRNHSLNQLKSIFHQKYKPSQMVQALGGKSSRNIIDSQENSNQTFTQPSLTAVPSNSQVRNKNETKAFHQNYQQSKRPLENSRGGFSFAEGYIEKQLQQQSKNYLNLKQSFNKQSSGYLSFHNNIDENSTIKTTNNSQQRKPSESIHNRSNNQSSHSNIINKVNNQENQIKEDGAYSMVQLLKPRSRNNERDINKGEPRNNLLTLNQTQQVLSNTLLGKELSRHNIKIISSRRDVSPGVSPFITSRVPKQQYQNYSNIISKEHNKSYERQINNVSLYFGQEQNKLKRNASRNKFNSIISNESCHHKENSNPNPAVYLNFADFKKAFKQRQAK